MSIFKDIIDIHKLTTYETGLLQTKAFRNLKERTGIILKPFSITSTEWAFLGMLSEYKNGIRSSDLAELLDVEAPFVTALVAKFSKKKWVTYVKSETDARAKMLMLTESGHELVKKIEPLLRTESKKWLDGISFKEIIAYIKVLKKLAE